MTVHLHADQLKISHVVRVLAKMSCRLLVKRNPHGDLITVLLLERSESDSGTLPKPVDGDEVVNVEKYILPFELACQSKHNRFTNTALDVIQVGTGDI